MPSAGQCLASVSFPDEDPLADMTPQFPRKGPPSLCLPEICWGFSPGEAGNLKGRVSYLAR